MSLATSASSTPVAVLICSSSASVPRGIDIDEADSRVAAEFERAKAYLDDRQWDEAVDILCRVMENSGQQLWALTPWRYISVREYCQLQLAALPPPALAIYRGRVDPLAEAWYKEGCAHRDRDKLLLVVRRAFASSFGDDALLMLGDMALERADYAAARGYWEKILPLDTASHTLNPVAENRLQPAVAMPPQPDDANASVPNAAMPPDARATVKPRTSTATNWLLFPDSDIPEAAVRARLVLASILEGSSQRARRELEQFSRLHAQAVGRLGGRETNYAQALRRLLNESLRWPPLAVSPDWPTFAGTQWREKISPTVVDAAGPAWRISLRKPQSRDRSRLSFHPAVVGRLIFVAKGHEILAFDLRTGRPAWGDANAVIFRDQLSDDHTQPEGQTLQVEPIGGYRNEADPAQYTLTAAGGLLLCRMDGPVSIESDRPGMSSATGGYLIGLDLQSEGRLLWRIDAENRDWAFEGAPVGDGVNVFAAMRFGGVRPQAYVACFDARTGRQRWRRFICGAEPLARTDNSRQLLTLKDGRIYYNTNLGAVAALSANNGELLWLSLYKRQPRSGLAASQPTAKQPPGACTLNPCLLHRGTLYVAPTDSREIFALNADTGRILWRSGTQVEDVEHLLGVVEDKLIASGKRLYWIATGSGDGGRIKHVWPLADQGSGFGRGVLAGQYVYWPTRETIYVFEQKSARLVDSIELGPKRAGGGNLVAARGHLIIATADELIVFARSAVVKHRDNATESDSL